MEPTENQMLLKHPIARTNSPQSESENRLSTATTSNNLHCDPMSRLYLCTQKIGVFHQGYQFYLKSALSHGDKCNQLLILEENIIWLKPIFRL